MMRFVQTDRAGADPASLAPRTPFVCNESDSETRGDDYMNALETAVSTGARQFIRSSCARHKERENTSQEARAFEERVLPSRSGFLVRSSRFCILRFFSRLYFFT